MAKNKKLKLLVDKQKDNDMPFKSSTILLDVMREEYAKERERSNAIDNKAGLFITAVIAIITVFIPMMPFDKILASYNSLSYTVVIETIFLCVFAFAFGILIWAFCILFNVINLKDYSRPNLQSLKDEEIQMQDECVTTKGLLDHLYTVVTENVSVNNDKAKQLQEGLKKSIIGFVLLAISTIGLNIIL